jgi:Zn-finger in ubiquitin-hydrolases and other protein
LPSRGPADDDQRPDAAPVRPEERTMHQIDPSFPPTGTGCVECDAAGGWWLHLRRCAACGHVGCCDSSPSQHASAHAATTGHRIAQSYEPGEDWFWDYAAEQVRPGPQLAPPTSRPADQPSPGPAGRLPADWDRHLH